VNLIVSENCIALVAKFYEILGFKFMEFMLLYKVLEGLGAQQ
jgi:hypothetical protein